MRKTASCTPFRSLWTHLPPRRRVASAPLAALLLGLANTGCEISDPYDDPTTVRSPVGTRDALAYIDEGNDEIVFVRPGDAEIEVVRKALGSADDIASWAVPNLDGSELLVLNVPRSAKVEGVEETLLRYAADGSGDPTSLDVLAPFTSVALSPDGRRAVLYFGQDAEGPALQNSNQVAIVDLDTNEVRNLTLNGFGGRLSSVAFPGQAQESGPAPIQIGNSSRDIVAFLAQNEIVMVDMDDANADQVAVKLSDGIDIVPDETLLRPGNSLFEDPVLFIRSSTSREVAMLSLIDKADEVTGDPGFTAQISLVSVGAEVGGGATDVVYYDSDDVPYLITSHSGALVFTNIETQNTFAVPVAGGALRVLLRDKDLGDGNSIKQSVSWDPGGNTIWTLDLDGIDSTLGRRPQRLDLERNIQQLVQLDNDRLLVGSNTVLYVIDLRERQITPLTSQVPYDPASAYLKSDEDALLLGTPEQSWVSRVDLANLNPENVLLDDTISGFFYLPGADKVVLTHEDLSGHLTVIDGDDPTRGSGYVRWGFLLEGALD